MKEGKEMVVDWWLAKEEKELVVDWWLEKDGERSGGGLVAS